MYACIYDYVMLYWCARMYMWYILNVFAVLLCLKTLFYALMFTGFVSKTASKLTRSSSVDVLHVCLRIYAFSTIVISENRINIIVSGNKIKGRN